jgi:hypothetical protein
MSYLQGIVNNKKPTKLFFTKKFSKIDRLNIICMCTRIVYCSGSRNQNCWCCRCNIVRAKWGRRGVGGLESKGEGSWLQARDLTEWEFTTLSKTSALQAPVSGFIFTAQGGYAQILIVCVGVCNIKIEFAVCRLKINHAWSTPSWVLFLGTGLMVAKHVKCT